MYQKLSSTPEISAVCSLKKNVKSLKCPLYKTAKEESVPQQSQKFLQRNAVLMIFQDLWQEEGKESFYFCL